MKKPTTPTDDLLADYIFLTDLPWLLREPALAAGRTPPSSTTCARGLREGAFPSHRIGSRRMIARRDLHLVLRAFGLDEAAAE